MDKKEYISDSLTMLDHIAKKLLSELKGGSILVLKGELGAGKTTFTKAMASGLGIHEEITSPTFTLMNLYQLPKLHNAITQLVHVDTYRLNNAQNLIDIGFLDYLGAPDTLTIIEWPEKIDEILKNKSFLSVNLEILNNDSRKITISD